MKPICFFGLGFMFFARFVSKQNKKSITFDQLKEPPAGANFYSLQKKSAVKNVGSNFNRN